MNLTIRYLLNCYREKTLTPRELIHQLLATCRKGDSAVWIRLLTEDELAPYFKNLDNHGPDTLPLFGIPFAVKDNIDLAGIPTTAGCPEFSYTPDTSAFVVNRLIQAGAIPIGKTNMDQFATGLVGTRSPYGACRNSFNREYISGGSSSGSAVAVARGMCSFSLGTDTAGSGRVPAAFNNIIGVKPTRGLLSTSGVVPACRSLDCLSVFSLCADDAGQIMQVATAYDSNDPYSRRRPTGLERTVKEKFTFGVPLAGDLAFFENNAYEACFSTTVDMLTDMGGTRVDVDFSPFLQAARLLYDGPWVAERAVSVGKFLNQNTDAGLPVTRQIICNGTSWSAESLFNAMYELKHLKQKTDAVLEIVDFLVTPTAGTCYTIAAVNTDPIALNTHLGYYTNYMNLLDYCSLAVPAALTSTVPFGVSLVGRAFDDSFLLSVGAKLHARTSLPMGCGSELPPEYFPAIKDDHILMAVCGAHLQGLPLHHQLTDLDAVFIRKTRTAGAYRMYALESEPPKPGLIRDACHGSEIEVEIYSLSPAAFGAFTARIPHPLGMGKLEMSDGSWVSGFIAESLVSQTGKEITRFGGWRSYLSETSQH